MQYRPVKERGEVLPWVKELKGKSGAYIIKERGLLGSVVYVGESHTGRLKPTLLRHFQRWKGPTSGPTFDAGKIEVAVIRTPAARAVATQDALILEFEPKHNTVGKPPGFWESIFGK